MYGQGYNTVYYGNGQVHNDMDCIIEPAYGLGGLYLGNYSAASNIDMLMRSGIRCIVTAALESNLNHTQDCIPFYVKYPGQDYEHFSMEPYLDPAADYIHQQLGQTNVLVHCMAGVSRSVTLIIAYLMKYRAMRMEDALTLVRSRRPVANPNPGFMRQLKTYEARLRSYGRTNNHLMPGVERGYGSRSPSPNPLRGSFTGQTLVYPTMPTVQPQYNLRGSQANQLTASWMPNFTGRDTYM